MKIIIIDIGSFSCKYGFGGYNNPIGEIRSAIVNDTKVLQMDDINIYKNIIYPVKNSTVQSYEGIEIILNYIIDGKLKIDPTRNGIIFCCHSKNHLDTYAKKRDFKTIHFVDRSVACTYGSGKVNSLIVKMGHDWTTISPVIEGVCLKNYVSYYFLGGKDVNKEIIKSTKEEWSDNQLSRFKKKIYHKKYFKKPKKMTFQKAEYKIKSWENIMISPKKYDIDIDLLANYIILTIDKSPIDLRKTLYSNIVFVGGNANIDSIQNKVISQIKKYRIANAKKNKNIIKTNYSRILDHPVSNKTNCCWIGGSIISSLI